jgi:hypothetical protein
MESFDTLPLQSIIPAYVYDQYSDDPNIVAIFDAINAVGQGYLDWFNTTPLALYTSPNVAGPLLDWVGQNLYGTPRPVISTSSTSNSAGMNSGPLNDGPMNGFTFTQSGTAQIATDDVYRRTLTWFNYAGDGKQMSIQWLKNRVARFLYGANGGDISLDETLNVGITQPYLQSRGAWNSYAWNTMPWNGLMQSKTIQKHGIAITVPSGGLSQSFADLVNSQILKMPFQMRVSVILG